ncbi:MAG: tetratricopeptide repeat protein, partial [bacterium]|nr:tetratricopeptide repeat protein [bacterium]
MENIKDKQPLFAKIITWGIYLTALVPLIIFSQFVSPFHFGKVVIFRSLVEILAVFYFVLVIKDRSFLPQKNILLWIFGAWALFFGISTIFSVNPYMSFWGTLERMGGFWSFLHYLVYFIILTSVFRKRENWLNLLELTILIGVLSAFYGFLQRTDAQWIIGSGGRERIFGTIGNPALFAGYQVINLFMALTLVLSSWIKPKHKPYLYIAAAVNLIAILMTVVRGSILAVFAGFFIMSAILVLKSKSAAAKKVLFGIISFAVVFMIFSSIFRNSSLVQKSGFLKRTTDFSLQTYTVQTRFWAWQAGLEGWKESAKTVFVGWGPETFNVPFSKHFNPKFFRGVGSETLFDRAHNMFVEILVTMGLTTFLVYVSMFGAIFWLLWRGIKDKSIEIPVGAGLISLTAAYIIHNFFIFDTSANFLVFFTATGFISWLTQKEPVQNESKRTHNYKSDRFSWSLTLVLLIATFVLIYKTNILQIEANYTTTRAIIKSWAGDFNGAILKYKEALNYDVPGKYDFRNRYTQWILEYTSGKKNGDAEKAAIKFGIEEMKKNVEENKMDYLPYLYLSRMNIILGKDDPSSAYNDEALVNSLKALEISPTFIRTYYEVAQAYLNKKDYQGAIKYFQEAIDLNPDVSLSYWYLGTVYVEVGKIKEGLENVEKARDRGYSFSETDIIRIVGFYL